MNNVTKIANVLTSTDGVAGEVKYNTIFASCMVQSASRNRAQLGDVCWAHHAYKAGRNTSRTRANHTTRRIPSVGFALGKDDPAKKKSFVKTIFQRTVEVRVGKILRKRVM